MNSSRPKLAHARSSVEAARALGTHLADGLEDAEAARRLRTLGPNAVTPKRGRSWLGILASQLKSLVVILLLAAAAIAFVLRETIEAIAILVVIAVNTAIGFITEAKANRALSALRAQTVARAHVIRGGVEREVPAPEFVVGDVVFLEAGEGVVADGRLVECVRLRIEEAALTGESLSVDKQTEALADEGAVLAERSNMAFSGTVITEGRGKMIVTATGADTEVGRIGRLIEEADTRDTPLERRLAALGRSLIGVVLVLAAIIVAAGWLRGATSFAHMLEIGIVLAIAAIPEGLPAVATMTLALGMQRMARRRALIRRLPAVETLGSTTVICTDKTGTLTRGEMTVVALALRGRELEVTGAGYAPRGEIMLGDTAIDVSTDEELALAVRIGALCNDAHVDRGEGKEVVIGDPTEAALFVLAEKAGLEPVALERAYPRLAELPFDPDRKTMVTVHREPSGLRIAYIKGAPASVLRACNRQVGPGGLEPLDDEARSRWHERNTILARRALRVLALAYRPLEAKDGAEAEEDHELERDLVFVGMVGMMDPLRPEAEAAVAQCRTAGIRTIMITGDQVETAAEISRQLGLDRALGGDPAGQPLRTVHARELIDLDAAGWRDIARNTAAFARTSPTQKLEIVKALQAQGQIVAMTGDGMNDAPALKQADVGVAMGIKGTEVAKQAADMVILDDRFATIERAVEEGRVVYGNILRFARYLFSCNVATIATVFIAVMLGLPPPLAALQILWINLVVDVIAATSLALEPSSPEVMRSPPRDPHEPILSGRTAAAIAGNGLLLALSTLVVFFVALGGGGAETLGPREMTIAFMTLALAQIAHVFHARSRRRSILSRRIIANPWVWLAVGLCVLLQLAAVTLPILSRVLHTTALAPSDWALVVAGALAPLGLLELAKLARRLTAKSPPDRPQSTSISSS